MTESNRSAGTDHSEGPGIDRWQPENGRAGTIAS
jgi:hypothetical protein